MGSEAPSCSMRSGEIHRPQVVAPRPLCSEMYSRELNFTPCGLVNHKNSCFVNVILNCLTYTEPFAGYLAQMKHKHSKEGSSKRCFLCCFNDHIERAARSTVPFLPGDVLALVPREGPIRLGEHNDAAEFLEYALGKMDLECSIGERSILKQIFDIELLNQTRFRCEEMKSENERFKILSVSSDRSLEHFLQNLTSEQEVVRECDMCKVDEKALERTSILVAPDILNFRLNYQSKTFKYPLELELAPYMSTSVTSHMYDLYAVIVYVALGDRLGHYFCYIQNSTKSWFKVNDTQVNIVENDEILSQTAYMLSYRRRITNLVPPVANEMQTGTPDVMYAATPRNTTPCHEMYSAKRWLPDCVYKRKRRKALNAAGSTGHESRMTPFSFIEAQEIKIPRLQFNIPAQLTGTSARERAFVKTRSIYSLDLTEEEIRWYKKNYVIPEEMNSEQVQRGIDEAMQWCDVEEGIFIFKLHSKGESSSVFDEKLQHFLLRREKTTCSSLIPRSSDKAKRLGVMMLALKEGKPILLNKFHYSYPGVFGKTKEQCTQRVSEAVDLAAETIGCYRHSLNVYASPTGRIIGDIIIRADGLNLDCSSSSKGGSVIPLEAEFISDIETKSEVRFILLVEKETVFFQLNLINFYKQHRCIIMTGRGMPDVATRVVLRKLSDHLGVPVYALVDPNPAGIQIVCKYRFGSRGRSFDNLFLTVPNLVWIGVFILPFISRQRDLEVLSPWDRSRMESLMGWKHIMNDEDLRAELLIMSDMDIKGDMHRLLTDDEIEDYICASIPEIQQEKE